MSPERLAAERCLTIRCARLITRREREPAPERCPFCHGNVAPVELRRPTRQARL